MRSSKPIFKIYKESPRNPNQHSLPLYLSQQNNLLYPSEEKYDILTLQYNNKVIFEHISQNEFALSHHFSKQN